MPTFIALVTNADDDAPSLGLMRVDAPDMSAAWAAAEKDRARLSGTPLVLDVDTPENLKKLIDEVAAGPIHASALAAKLAARRTKSVILPVCIARMAVLAEQDEKAANVIRVRHSVFFTDDDIIINGLRADEAQIGHILSDIEGALDPRFVLCVGAVRERFPDIPDSCQPADGALLLWDRQEKTPVVTVAPAYAQMVCLEQTVPATSAPLENLENWLNNLSNAAFESEGIPATRPRA